MAELLGLGEVLEHVGQRHDRPDDPDRGRVAAHRGVELARDLVRALVGRDLVLEDDGELVGVDSVRDALQRPLEERVVDPLGLLLEGEQPLLAGEFGDLDHLVDHRLRLRDLAEEGAREGLDGEDRVGERRARDPDGDGGTEHEDHRRREQHRGGARTLHEHHREQGPEGEEDADDCRGIHQAPLTLVGRPGAEWARSRWSGTRAIPGWSTSGAGSARASTMTRAR